MKFSPNHLKRYQEIAKRITTGIILAVCQWVKVDSSCRLLVDPGLAIVGFPTAAGGFRQVISIFVQDHKSRKQSFR